MEVGNRGLSTPVKIALTKIAPIKLARPLTPSIAFLIKKRFNLFMGPFPSEPLSPDRQLQVVKDNDALINSGVGVFFFVMPAQAGIQYTG